MSSLLRKLSAVLLVSLIVVGAVAVFSPTDAWAKGKPGGGGPCGACPCAPTVGDCYLDSCHLLFPSECLWDCHYICPFPG